MPSEEESNVMVAPEALAVQIQRGFYDEWVEDLLTTLEARKRFLDAKNLRKWKIGEHAIIHNVGMGGKYMNGVLVEIVDIKVKRLTVLIKTPGVLFRGRAKQLVVYPTMLRPLTPEEEAQRVANEDG